VNVISFSSLSMGKELKLTDCLPTMCIVFLNDDRLVFHW